MQMIKPIVGICAAMLLSVCVASADLSDRLAAGSDFSIRLTAGRYELTGGVSGTGNFTSSAYRFVFLPDGNGLGWQLRVRDLVNAILSDYMLHYVATVLPNGDVQWDMDASPNECTQIVLGGQPVNFLLTRIYGRFTSHLTAIDCQADPHNRLTRNISLRLDSAGGDDGNNLFLEGYLFCFQSAGTLTNGRVHSLVSIGYGGGIPKSMGNVNNDCAVDDGDLLQVLFAFGSDDEASDVNGDGMVDDADLLVVLFNFGLEG
jgi:hypothetical protein